jgi:GH18 family chitinase
MPLTIYVQLDVDYEYPSNDAQARGYVELLRELRHALDAHAARKGTSYRFLLTVRTAFTWTLCRTCKHLLTLAHGNGCRSRHRAVHRTTRSCM